MNLTHLGVSQVKPDGTVLGDSNEGTPRFEQARMMRPHNGMTVSERVAAGCGTPSDMAWHAEQNRLHQLWKQSPEGQQWLKEKVLK